MLIVSHFLKLIINVFVLKVLVFVHPEKVTEGFQIILNYLDRHARVCFFSLIKYLNIGTRRGAPVGTRRGAPPATAGDAGHRIAGF